MEAPAMSASARKRANKKARDAAFAEAEAQKAPEPAAQANKENKPKEAPKAAAPKAKAAGKAEPVKPEPKAQGKAQAKADPKAAAKATAKATAAPAAKAAAAPVAAQPAAAKAGAKAGAKAKAKAVKEEAAPKPPAQEVLAHSFVFTDDGKGGWETNDQTKKKAKQAEKKKQAEQQVTKVPSFKEEKPQQQPRGQKDDKSRPQVHVPAHVHEDIARILAPKEPAAQKVDPERANDISVTMNVPEAKVRVCIGAKGSTINMIQEKTGVHIDTAGEIFTLKGSKEAVDAGKKAINEIITKGYTSLQYPNFAEDIMMVPQCYLREIIGAKGATIRKLKEKLEVDITIPDAPRDDKNQTKKHKVQIAGDAEKIDQAKAVINDIMQYYHSEVTHPGQVHEELELEQSTFRYIIGPSGSEMRHIENNYKVKVNIPREYHVNQKVVVVGEKVACEKARAYIEKKIADRESAREKADDWNKDEDEE